MQTSMREPRIGREGGIANIAARFVMSVAVALAAGIKPGRVAILDASGNAILPVVAPAVDMAADVDAFYTTTATAASIVTLDSATGAGVIGLTELTVARRGTLTLNSHADWNATTATWTYIDHMGRRVVESIAIPDAGNVTLYTQGLIAKHISLVIPAQAGTNGSFTVGVAAAAGADVLSTGTAGAVGTPTTGAALNYRRLPGLAVFEHKAGNPPDYSNTNRATHAQYSVMPHMRKGYMYVKPEDAVVKGQDVFVRIIAAGAEEVGRVRGTPDSTDCVRLEGARFFTAASSDEIAILEVDIP